MTTSERLRAARLPAARGPPARRAKAQAAIEAGLVQANGATVRKASVEVARDAAIEASPAHPYVSRGGVKRKAALDHFAIAPKGRTCLDVGASTGGFTQVLIARGALRVYAVDVGKAQLHAALRGRPEIVSLEETDIRKLSAAVFAEPPCLVTIDVSFISLKQVLPAASALAAPAATLVSLIKPQFEAGRERVKKGVVRDTAVHQAVCDDIAVSIAALGWRVSGVIPSPITGGDGNREFLLGAETAN